MNTEKAVERMAASLDEASKTEEGRRVLGDVAERLARLFGGTVSAPKPVVQEQTAPVVEQTEFDVLLADIGPKKIEVIKAVREIISPLGLKEAKDFIEKTTERCVKSGTDKVTAMQIKAKLETAGAKVVLR